MASLNSTDSRQIPLSGTTGIIYYLAGNGSLLQTNNPQYAFAGAGFALVTVNKACDDFQVTRIFRNQWFGNVGGRSGFSTPYNETFYGDHGALLANDGYVYLYGGIPNTNSDVGLARVKKGQAFNLLAYEYGTARLSNANASSTLHQPSPS